MKIREIDAATDAVQAILTARIPQVTDAEWRQIIKLAYEVTAAVDKANEAP